MISTDRMREVADGAAGMDELILADMIARAVAFVETQTRRYFGPPALVTEYLSGNGSRMLQLSEPVTELDSDDITLLEERAYPGGDATVLLDGAGFLVRSRNTVPPSYQSASFLVRSGGLVWTRGSEYAVTYARGYTVDEGPKDIEQVIIDLVEARLTPSGAEVMQSETIGGYAYQRFKDADLDVIDGGWDTIRFWRRAVFA